MKTGRFLALAVVATMAVLGGCRNPFNPSARIRFDRFFVGSENLPSLTIPYSTAGTLATGPTSTVLQTIRTKAQLSNASSVPGKITGYNVVYRQISDGQPIAVCGGAAGRRFSALIYIPFLADNSKTKEVLPNDGAYVLIVTSELLTYISTAPATVNGGIDCEVTFYGEDDNGYDIQVEGVLHIDVL